MEYYAKQPAISTTTFAALLTCESGWRQFWPDGSPLISSTSDVGLGQINQIHWAEAKAMGLDIFYSAKDNLDFTFHMIDESGIKPWYMSKSCQLKHGGWN